MGTAKDFFIQLPILCKAKNAERWAWINAIQFKTELPGGTIFDRNEDDKADAFNRLETAFGFTAFDHDEARAYYCKILGELFILAHYAKEHGETGNEDRIKFLIEEGATIEGDYPEIDAVMTVAQAAEDNGWS
jgi:hypothetical protein